jgi:hypothetical protein
MSQLNNKTIPKRALAFVLSNAAEFVAGNCFFMSASLRFWSDALQHKEPGQGCPQLCSANLPPVSHGFLCEQHLMPMPEDIEIFKVVPIYTYERIIAPAVLCGGLEDLTQITLLVSRFQLFNLGNNVPESYVFIYANSIPFDGFQLP